MVRKSSGEQQRALSLTEMMPKNYLRGLHRLFLELGLDSPHRSLAKRGHAAGLPTQRHSDGRWGLQA